MSNNKAPKWWDAMAVYVGRMAYVIEALSRNGVVEAQMNVWEALTRIDIEQRLKVKAVGILGDEPKDVTFLALYYYIPNLQALSTWRI